ncbi:MAG: methylmalonyl-CoA epimerase [Bacteroidetes bacterium]|nr:methylmalonyl-CoA epimerase [Bacteroidota bacterium]
MNKIEHIGIAVKNLEESNKIWSLLLNTEPYKQEIVESEGVITSFFKTGESKIELLASVSNGSAIEKFIEKRGEGIHHIAFEVNDIDYEIERLENNGFVLINKSSKKGADNKMIAFLHPKSSGGVLVELCMEMK